LQGQLRKVPLSQAKQKVRFSAAIASVYIQRKNRRGQDIPDCRVRPIAPVQIPGKNSVPFSKCRLFSDNQISSENGTCDCSPHPVCPENS
jgi:hypothetical protein